MNRFILYLVIAIFSLTANAGQPRSAAARAEFVRLNPCPATGQREGSCPGYVVDHIQPLCDGGADDKSNMQWQPVEKAKEKDGWERMRCSVTSMVAHYVPHKSDSTDCGKTTCGQMASCAEAQFYLSHCRAHGLDRDGDGVACESLCK